ncbi:hypothetical protein A3Q56_02692 [Intoshia linei]|uniref:G-protein coupled receptors family 1 profile domain-containing protein n=1 Tax=Intoshia linei TaxID=1819745 RepID=A0A177B750_9BILA|nr:hypothetical protein A3Q56_02692 [Intoshia linei]
MISKAFPGNIDWQSLNLYETISAYIWLYVPPILIPIGMIGNILIICVINRKVFHHSTTRIYMITISTLDIVVLLIGSLPEWLEECQVFVFKELGGMACKFEKFFFYTSSDTSIWILVLFAFDRCIAVMHPLKKRIICTEKNTVRIIIIIFALTILKNIHVFWTRGPVYSKTNSTVIVKMCGQIEPHFEKFVRPWIAFTLITILPFITLFICNILIVIALQRSQKKFIKSKTAQMIINRVRLPPTTVQKPELKITEHTELFPSSKISKTSLDSALKLNISTVKNKIKNDRAMVSMTLMCLSSSFTFLICVAPNIIILIGKPYWKHTNAYIILKAINSQISNLNYTIDFFLYCFSGTKFRKELRNMLFGKKRKSFITR